MRKTLKSVICAVMVLAMMLTMTPSYAFAEGNTESMEYSESDTGQEGTETETLDQTEETETDSKESSEQTDVTDKPELTETEQEEADSEESSEQTKSDAQESDTQILDDSSSSEDDKQKSVQRTAAQSASVSEKNVAPQADGESDDVYLGSADLNQFTTKATILKDGEETTELNDGDTYTVRLGFREESGTEGQINFNELMTYTLPDGLTLVDTGENISIRASVRTDDGQMQTVTVSFTIGRDSDGNVTLEPRAGQETELELLSRADNASFEMYVDVRYNGEAEKDKLDFGNDIIKEITVTSESDLTINKTASYNKANGTVDYTLTITSSGTNTNVHLSDTIGGDAVTLDPDTIQVSSNMGTTDAQVTASGKTLTSNNFNMTGGEVVTVTYSAAVDYTKLDGNIIDWDDTKNTLSVDSDKNRPEDVSAGINHQTAFDYASKSNVGGFDSDKVSEDGRSYILSWQIVVNPDFMDTGDITITDTLGNTDLQSYDPNSFRVGAVTKDGTAVDLSRVTFAPPSATDTAWTQTLPSVVNGHPVRYTITYNTLVDKEKIDDSWTQTMVSNDLDVPGTEGDSSISVDIPAQNDYQVTKEYTAADMSAQTVDWLITVTAPQEGFDTFTVTDTLPGTWINSTWYGSVAGEDSLVVKVNDIVLTQGNDYDVDWTQNKIEQGQSANFTITFKTGANGKGLAAAAEGTGDQTVTIAFKSNYKDTGWPEGQMMTNSVNVTANEVTHGATASYTPADKTIEKTVNNNGSFNDSNLNKEVTYSVAITGVTESDLDGNGQITVTDTYNSKYLRIVENPYWLDGTNVAGTNAPGNYDEATGSDYRYTISYGEPAADGTREASFTFTPIRDSGGNLYSRYYFTYNMAITDADAMRELVEAAASDPSGSLSAYLSNTAAWGNISDEYTVGFESRPMSKSVITGPGVDNNQTITWRLAINQNKARLNNGNPMELVDDFTVQDPSEYEMTYVDGSMSVSYDNVLQDDVDYTYTESENGGGTLTWSIPDETAVVIEYQTQIVGDTTGKTQFHNRASMNGEEFTDNAGQDYTIDSGGSGTASTLNFDILKQDINDLTQNLPGAEFELYADDGNGNPTPMVVRGQETIPSFVTNSEGVIQVTSDQQGQGWALQNHHIYYLKEVTAPEGYDIPEEGIWVKIWITEFGDSDIDEEAGEVALPDDAIIVNNNTTIRVTNGQVTVPVSKELLGGNWEDGEQYQVEIVADPASEKVPPMPLTSTLTFSSDSADYFVLSGFTKPGTYRYLIREIVPANTGDVTYSGAVYSLVVTAVQRQASGDSSAHLEVDYTLTQIRDDQGNESDTQVSSADFVNSKGSGNLSLTKVVAGTTTESTFNVQITLNNTSVNGQYGDIIFENGVAAVQLTAGQTKTASGLPAGVKYTVTEVNVPDGYQVSYSGETGTITAGETVSAKVTNTYHRTTDISVEKNWVDNNDQDGKRSDSIQVQLYADGVPYGSAVTLSASANPDNNWKYTWTGLDAEANGTAIKYTVREVGETNGTIQFNGAIYYVTYSGSDSAGYTITNSHMPETVSATIRKVWNDADDQDGKRPQSISVALMNGNTLINTVTLNSDNRWTATVENLSKYTNGIENVYSWTEDMTGMPEGYTLTGSSTEGTVTTLTNSYTPDETGVNVTKRWNDNNNQDGIRPNEITVKLMANGKDTGKTLILNAANNWSGTFTGLAKYENGKTIEYTVEEARVEGYEKAITGNMTDGFIITNSHIPETTEVSGSKTWNDNNDQDGKRPKSITINLLANGNEIADKEVSANDNWSWSFTNLPQYENGREIIYTITEDAVPDYTTEVNGYNVTNTYTPGKTDVSVIKSWDDADDQDGKRPANIQVQLYADGEAYGAPVTLRASDNPDDNWKYTWTGLDERSEGKEIEYTVKEVGETDGKINFDGTEYQVTYAGDAVTGYTITNGYTPGKTSISVTKSWDDADDQDGKRPESIRVQLYADGKAQGEPVVLNTANKWSHIWSELDEKAGGKVVEYTVKEVGETGGKTTFDGTEYQVAYTGDAETGYMISNSHIPETTEVSGKKTWNDNNDQDGKRPESITINLLANGNEIADKEVSADDNWSWNFTDLPKYENGTEIIYTITEDAVVDYTTVVNGYDIINSYTPDETSVSVTKSWQDNNDQDGIRPNEITVKLLANSEDTGKTLTLNAANSWSGSFTGLAKYEDREEIKYTVEEEGVEGYETVVTGNMTEGYIITNSHNPETTEVSGSKTWNDNNDQDGKRPESITIRLLANGTEIDKKEISADDNWSWNFTDLPKYENGTEITYTITEDAVKDYTTEINGYDVTNNYRPGKTSVAVTKSWADSDDQDGKRPESIQVQLYADGEKQGEPVVLAAENNWSYIWSELDEKSAGKAIEYTVKEVGESDGKIDFDGTGYQVTYTGDAATGYTITNSYASETTEVSGSKTWNDNNNQDGKRPESITIRLLANGTEVDKKEVSANDNWSWSFTDLPKYENRAKITYTITEDAVPGYTTVVNGYDVTNSYTPDETSISVTKNWQDNNDQDGIRPNEITVKLMANGEDTGKALTLNAANSWSGSFTGLAKYEDGEEIKYIVEEEGVEGYTTDVTGNMTEGYIITNSHNPETTEVSGSKSWNDNNDQEGKRPKSIIIRLLANGTEVAKKEISADDDWSWNFTDLPKYENGAEITYTITEDAVPDYTTEINGYDVTNNYKPGKTSVTVTKSWNDSGDQDGKRPDSIQVQLYADGEEQGEPVVLAAENNWSYIWSELDEKSAGKAIEYTVKEVGETEGKIDFDGAEYQVTYTGDAAAGYEITNSYNTERVEVSGSKTWNDKGNEGIRPESIMIRLYADNEEVARAEVTAENDWSWSFDNLPKYRDGGQEIIYTISEDAVDNYITEVNGYDVTNTYQPGETSVSVAKRWNDSGNRDGKRPESVKVQLYADDEALGDPVILNRSNDWRYTWSELDKQADGKEIVYTVKEVGENKGTIDFDGTEYKVTYTGNAAKGYTITNSYNAVSTSVQTGDDTNMRSNLAVMAAAMTVAGAVLIFRRRRYNKK